jgi:tRNA pseudouridine38-40 synthase
MAKVRLDLAYDGSGFRGYARQEGLRTVQGALEDALATLLGRPVETSVAGRTDAGVHALGQVVSIDVDGEVDLAKLARSLNGLIGPEIAVMSATHADDAFDARFSAVWRIYRYAMDTGEAPNPLRRGYEWHVGSHLDRGAMAAAARHFIGEQDFSAFCRASEGSSNVRRVDQATWEADGNSLHFWIRSNSFCHQMVRSLVGLCYDVGRGFTPVGSVREIIDGRDRGRVVTVAPPHGLVLWEVGY